MRVKTILIAAGVLFGIPLATLLYLYLTGGELVLVHNATGRAIQVAAVTSDGRYVEHTEPETLAARGFTWIIFFPHIKGRAAISCRSDLGMANTALGTADDAAPMLSNVTLKSCAYNLRAPITPPQPG